MKTQQKYFIRVDDKYNQIFNDFVNRHKDISPELVGRDTAYGKGTFLYSVRMDTETELAMKLSCSIKSCQALTGITDKSVDKE